MRFAAHSTTPTVIQLFIMTLWRKKKSDMEVKKEMSGKCERYGKTRK
jgi:hypothetical protein